MATVTPSFGDLLEDSYLTPSQKKFVRARYMSLLTDTESGYFWTSFFHHLGTNVVMLAGIIVASLIPLNEFTDINLGGALAVFWITWSCALIVTTVTGIMRVTNVSKKYILDMTELEKLRAEGWAFLAGIGRYATPAANFQLFCARIEKINTGAVIKSIEFSTPANQRADIDTDSTVVNIDPGLADPTTCIPTTFAPTTPTVPARQTPAVAITDRQVGLPDVNRRDNGSPAAINIASSTSAGDDS